MTGKELLRELQKMSLDQLNQPVSIEQHFNLDGVSRACRAVIFDPDMREIVLLSKGPFD